MNIKNILVTGGAGYIGSHAVKLLAEAGYMPIVYDSLEEGHKEAVPQGVKLIKANLADTDSLRKTFQTTEIDAVMHFAGYIQVAESVQEPLKYYSNNVSNTVNLLQIMKEFNVKKFIFSSSAAVYGNPKKIPITEDMPEIPSNPYGETKLIVEKILKYADAAYGLKSVSLRYFNAAGADPNGKIGEMHRIETHLIPLAIRAALTHKPVFIFGNDYPTKDGTCIRDYIHVNDLADAHILGLKYLENAEGSSVFNLGNGNGYSVKEIIEKVEEITGEKIEKKIVQRRPGDPAVLVASSKLIKRALSWEPRYPGISDIIGTAWNWHRKILRIS